MTEVKEVFEKNIQIKKKETKLLLWTKLKLDFLFHTARKKFNSTQSKKLNNKRSM